MIFDTTFLIDVMQKDEKALSLLHLFGEKSEYGLVSAVSIFELHSGLARSGKSLSEQNKVKEVLDKQRIIPIDALLAENAGDIHGVLITRGQMIGSMDCLIAATALRFGETVLTRNVKDFQRISGLKVETY